MMATPHPRELQQSWPRRLTALRSMLAGLMPLPSGRQRRHRLHLLLPQLAEHRQALTRLATDTEVTFLGLGRSLQAQAGASGNLVTQGKRLLDFSTDGAADHDAIGAAVALIRHTLGFVEDCAEQARELVARLESYHERTGHLLHAEQQVERILAPLRIIETLFRIETVLLPPEMQAGFNALSGEIPRFEAEVRQTVGQHAEKLAGTRLAIETTTTRLRERSALQRETVATERVRISQTLAGLEREIAHGHERNAHLNELIGRIDREIGALVVHLQYQDIARQKMEHIGGVLDEIQTRSDPDRRAAGDPAFQAIHESCRLEALQTEAVREELDRALTGITAGVRAILARLAQIETECWPRTEFKAVGGAVTERVATLQTILREMHELLPMALACADEAIGVIDGFSDVAANVATTAREMAESMRLIALNAQVLAAQAGERGAGLLVLAENTYAISADIRQITNRISTEFVEADGQLRAVVEQCATLKRHAEERRQEFETRNGAAGPQLQAQRDETVHALGRLGELLEEIHTESAAMLRAAEAKEGFCLGLEQLHGHLLAVSRACAATPGLRGTAEQTAGRLNRLARHYTMASEREVHAAALAATEPNPPAPAPEPVSVGAENEPTAPNGQYGANVEMF